MDELPAIGTADMLPTFTPQESDFLRHYSEELVRATAMEKAGLGASPDNQDAWQAMQELASSIIARAEQMPLQAILSAVGGDRVMMCGAIVEVCRSPKYHERIQGLKLMGHIHGAWGDARRHHARARALVLEPPRHREPPRRVANLPFVVPDVDNGGSS